MKKDKPVMTIEAAAAGLRALYDLYVEELLSRYTAEEWAEIEAEGA